MPVLIALKPILELHPVFELVQMIERYWSGRRLDQP